ncbi:DNA-binding winged helix-turn-helix (wHTH) protein/tetratricopeptide (TPR) repeat protein [Dokdonella fugitiva]|uniref:DNA-binding winged helix-turn-helix (WHTH) protein/tetratricopeptide (TPR) repeat protein n=1 Tax=Dokdonella fugitiva TaxID=328517 RepID=A0A839F5F1_9GAMM|nr:winged helix-turn-helix domain-containing protein [Dokdonella fugitiva]MBA8887411.1 DNA-binding winged helix-turn-helix (wHTH) protein/tetratricopeptide (TPR) repeat protein [Dokdonella fugitiva]
MTSHEYRFGDYRLAPAARELWYGEQLVALPPKSLDCLIWLVEHRERAVGRDELISAVWGRVDVSDDVLAQTLLRARRAVGDTGNEQRAIRTVPRFGYRWVLAVEEVGASVAPAAEATVASAVVPPAAAPERARVGARVLVAVAVVVFAAVVFAFAWSRRGASDAAPSAVANVARGERVVMVLPVDVRGGDRGAAWVRLGAMDFLAANLRGAGLKVLPSEQTLLLASGNFDPADAGTLHRLELSTGARYIVAPQATWADDAWAVVLDVYHDGGVLSYEARADNPLDASSLALARFAAALGVTATPAARSGAATELVQRMDAALLAGDLEEAHRLADTTPANLAGDPAVRVRTGQIAFRAGRLDEATALLQPLADDAAVAADPRAQAQMGLGAVAVRRGDFDAAERAYSAAITMLANVAANADLLGSAYSGRGVAHGARGHADAALADFARARVEFERAGDRTGAATVEVNAALVEGGRGRYDQADAAFDRAIATFNRFDVRDNLAAALLGKANAQLALLDDAGALASSERAVNLAAQLENPLLKRRVAAVRASALITAGALAAAERVLDENGGAAAGDREFEQLRATLAFERGDGAQASARVASLLDRGRGDADLTLSNLVLVAAEALRRGGDTATLERVLHALQTDADASGDRDRAFALELGAAALAVAHGSVDAATHFDAALVAADRRGSPEAVARVAVAALAWRLQQADRAGLDAAATLVGRLVAWDERDYRCARAAAAYYRAIGDGAAATAAEAAQRRLAGERDPRLPL